MVADGVSATAWWHLFAADPVLEQLDVPRRAFVVGILISLILIALMLVACIMIGGRWVRRLARHSRGPTPHASITAGKRLRKALEPILPEGGQAGETTVVRRKSDDTTVDP